MQKMYLILLLILTVMELFGQNNIVPNPNFEIHDSCPSAVGQISKARYWSGILVTPDYHHVCATHWHVSVPSNHAGYQLPISVNDSAYAGLATSLLRDSVREIIGIELSQALVVGEKYYFSFWLSAGSSPGSSPCYNNRFGVKFITYLSSLSSSNKELVDNYSHFNVDTLISDTLNWNRFSASFIADSTYTAVLFGNFYTIDSINFICRYNVPHPSSYYYIDNVCVSIDSNECIDYNSIIPESPYTQEILVSFNNNTITLDVRSLCWNSQMRVYDVGGKLLKIENLVLGINTINYDYFAGGMYFIRINEATYKFIRY